MSIVQTDIPMTSERCIDTILKLTEAYPFCRSEELTVTAFGRPIRTLVLGTGPQKVIYSAAHHANEWITTLVLLKFAEELAEIGVNALLGYPQSKMLCGCLILCHNRNYKSFIVQLI